MSWQEKVKEWGGGDLAFLSEDGESIRFVVVGEPVLLEGKFKNRQTVRVGCPIVSDDGFVLFVTGKRVARKLAKYEERFGNTAFIVTRHGEQNDINATYELKLSDDEQLAASLIEKAKTEYKPELLQEAITAALEAMQN